MRRNAQLLGVSMLGVLVFPLALARFIWLPDGQRLLGILLALLVGAGTYLFTVSGMRDRERRRSVIMSVVSGVGVVLLVLTHLMLSVCASDVKAWRNVSAPW